MLDRSGERFSVAFSGDVRWKHWPLAKCLLMMAGAPFIPIAWSFLVSDAANPASDHATQIAQVNDLLRKQLLDLTAKFAREDVSPNGRSIAGRVVLLFAPTFAVC